MPLLQSGCLDAPVLDRAANCYMQIGDTQTAASLLEVITQTQPRLASGWGKLAALKMTVGDEPGAIMGFRKVLEITPNSGHALAALNRLEPYKRNSAKVARLRKLAKSNKLPQSERVAVLNTLGQVEHNTGHFKSAFRYFAKSKAAAKAEFHPEAMDDLVDGQIGQFQATGIVEENSDGPRIVFIVGMPRSGTTMLEQILTRHSQTHTVGESPALTKTLQAVRHHVGDKLGKADPWDWCDSLTDHEISIFRRYYYTCAGQNAPLSGDVFVDKMPFNSFHLGLAHLLLPDAKFVFMSRHPLDVGLSNFSINFQSGNEFSRRLEWIGQMTRTVYRSMQDYKQKLPNQLRVQSYQKLVSCPEGQIKALLDHIGLPWRQDCLSPGNTDGAIRTASVQQARKEINTDALNKWKPYEEQLQPLIAALGGQEWIQNWQELDNATADC